MDAKAVTHAVAPGSTPEQAFAEGSRTMQMTGEYRIEAPRQKVWDALNDPEVLKACIPGCEEIEKTSDTSFAAKVKAKVGPVSARFSGSVELSEIDPPNGYRISGEGKGGAAGVASGGARVKLTEDGAATLLQYQVDAKVGGKLAQIGSRLVDGTAKKLAGDFFGAFAELVSESPAVEEATSAAKTETPQSAVPDEAVADPNVGAGVAVGVWVIGLISAVLILLAFFAI